MDVADVAERGVASIGVRWTDLSKAVHSGPEGGEGPSALAPTLSSGSLARALWHTVDVYSASLGYRDE